MASSSATPSLRHLITGGAGFLGSHLTDALLAAGDSVTVIDSFLTSDPDNIAHLRSQPRFTLIQHDLTRGLPELGGKKFDRIWHLASPASPVGYVKHQVTTL